jgi:hypothetical protein
VSEFRQKYKIEKLREMNDLHHAEDAYLNIVVGNVMHEKFTKKWYKSGEYDARRFREDAEGNKLPSLNFHAIFGIKDKPQENPLTTLILMKFIGITQNMVVNLELLPSSAKKMT